MRGIGFRWTLGLLVGATLLPYALFMAYGEWHDRRVAEAQVLESARQSARQAAHVVDLHLSHMSTTLAVVERAVADSLHDSRRLEATLQRTFPAMAATLDNVAVFATDGQLIARGLAQPGLPGDVNVADRAYFRAVLATRAPAISEPFVSRLTGLNVVAMGRPVLDASGAVVAVLAATTGLDKFERLLAGQADSPGTVLWVATSRGATVARVGAPGAVAFPGAEGFLPFRGAGDGQAFLGAVTTPDGVARLGASEPVRAAPWQAFVGVPKSEAFAVVEAQRREHAFTAGAMLLASLLAAWALARRLALPVLRLRRAVRALASDGDAPPVPLDDRGEFGELAREVNRVSQRLADARADLNAVLSLSSDWYWETDASMRFTKVGGTFGDVEGTDAAKIVGRTYLECGILPADPDAHAAVLAAHQSYRNEEFTVRDRDGRALYVLLVSGEPRFAPDGAFLGYRGACRDVTESRRLEGTVRSARERLRLIVDAVPALIAYVDADGRYVFCNRQYAALFGLEPRQVVGRPVAEVVGAGTAASIEGGVRRALRGERVSFEAQFAPGGGAARDYLVQLVPDAEPDGHVTGYVGMMTDVTELRVGQRALAASERRFRELTELSSDWYWEQDAEYRFTYQSGAGRGHSDFTAYVGKRRWDVPALNLSEADWAVHRAALERREPFYDFEMLRQDSSGRSSWASVSGRPTVDADGRFAGYVGVGRDITARKLAEEALHAERDRLARIIGTMGEGLAILDTAGCFTRVNGAALRILGAELPAMLGRHFSDGSWMTLRARSSESAGMLAELFYRLASGVPTLGPRDHVMVAPDGSEVFLSMTGARLQGDDGAFAGVVVTFEDVTARKLQEREIVKLNEDLDRRVQERTAELRAAYRDMESFSYNVSHDLRAPLRAITGFSSMLVEDHGEQIPREARRLLDRVVKNAEHMEQLIEGLLAFGRLTRQPLSLRRASVRDIVDDVAEELRAGVDKRRLDLRIGPLPDAWADPVLLRQVYANLLSNAIKYSSKAERPRIEVGAIQEGTGTTYYVRDNGAGFDMAYAGKLFGMFQRLHAPAEFEGNGVGLAMVRRIIERHGGEIWAESAPGEGATFWFKLDGGRFARDAAPRTAGRAELREVGRPGTAA